MEDLRIQIYTYLTYYAQGRKKAIKANTLATHYQINIREANEIIRQLRKEGKLIGSAKEPPYGYYLPATEEETKEYIKTFRSEMLDMLGTYNKQKRAQKNRIEQFSQPEFIKESESGQLELLYA